MITDHALYMSLTPSIEQNLICPDSPKSLKTVFWNLQREMLF